MALSTELIEFLVEFSIALHRTSMYPAGHPSQERSASGVVQRLAALLQERASISIGIAKHQIVIEGVASDPKHPVLRSLSEKFHRQHIGAVVIQRGATAAEVADMMQLVATEVEKGARPLGLADPEALRKWHNVRLYALTYDQLELVGDAADDEENEDEREQGARSAQLWMGLARAALASETATLPPDSTEPTVVARAINEHPQAQAYDQVLVGYLLQIAQELKRDGGGASDAVRKRMSRLIGALDPETLQRLVRMGDDLEQRRQFVLDATDSLAVDAVVDIVRSAGEASGQTISNSMMRMLSKLSAFAEQGPAALQAQADSALRDQVRELIGNWSLTDPNPDAYTRALQSMAVAPAGERATTDAYAPEATRIVQMAIEVQSVGTPFWRAARILEQTRLGDLIAIMLSASPDNPVAEQLWQRLANEANVRALLARDVVDFSAVGPLLDRMPADSGIVIMLDTLVESESRATRMGLFKRIVAMGPDFREQLVERLMDERWYVKRNMLAMLNEMQVVPSRFSPADYARHGDARVRREALQLWLRVPGEQERAIMAALREADDRGLRIGIAAALKEGTPEPAVPVIANRLSDRNLTTDIRLQLVRLLGQVRTPLAAETLLKVVVAGKTFLGAPKFAETTPLLLVALTTLAQRWPDDARVKAVVQRARTSKDPDVTAAVAKTK